MFFEVPLDAEFERHTGGGAADTGPVEAYFYDTVLCDVDEFDISAVGLDCGPDQVEYPKNTFLKWKGCLHGE